MDGTVLLAADIPGGSRSKGRGGVCQVVCVLGQHEADDGVIDYLDRSGGQHTATFESPAMS
jgi:hypothetical protein